MEIGSQRRSAGGAHAGTLEFDHRIAPAPSLVEVAFELPHRLTRAARVFLHGRALGLGTGGINVAPMSDEWLGQFKVDCDKHGDAL